LRITFNPTTHTHPPIDAAASSIAQQRSALRAFSESVFGWGERFAEDRSASTDAINEAACTLWQYRHLAEYYDDVHATIA
jgi:hypothetical protein